MKLKPSVKNAILIGTLCSISYFAVYNARNVLGAVSAAMIEQGVATRDVVIGTLPSLFFVFYAVGQLINGVIGNHVKARYMLSFGLLLAGISNLVFPAIIQSGNLPLSYLCYGLCGFFLSMIYGPMTKVVAENTEPVYTTRCSLGYTLASFLGSPSAGFLAAFISWQSVFRVSSMALFLMAACCFGFFLLFEKKGIVRYGQYKRQKSSGGSVKVLITKYQFIKFCLISIITGVIRTSVVSCLTTYSYDHLNFSEDKAPLLFSIMSCVIALSAFVSISIYEALHRNMDATLLLMFSLSSVFFLVTYFVHSPLINLIVLTAAILCSNCSATMLWSRYCPGLRDTGVVSGATGFLDFLSYMAAGAANAIFGAAVVKVGWSPLILVWMGLMLFGVIVSLPYHKIFKKKKASAKTEA